MPRFGGHHTDAAVVPVKLSLSDIYGHKLTPGSGSSPIIVYVVLGIPLFAHHRLARDHHALELAAVAS